jgi:FkbM family methyltransferase
MFSNIGLEILRGSMIKTVVRNILSRLVNRERFNDSIIYGAYLRIFLPHSADKKLKERIFYKSALKDKKCDLIFDVGANAGSKAVIFLQHAKRVICIEPNPETLEHLSRRFSNKPQIELVRCACGAHSGTTKMLVFQNDSAYATLSEKWTEEIVKHRKTHKISHEIEVPLETIDNLISKYGRPYYIKIDVEGFELEVIRGLSRLVPLISFECNLPTFKSETLDIISILLSKDSSVLFNYSISEPPEFVEDRWLSGSEMSYIVGQDISQYMEIFCRTSNNTSSH